MSLARAAVVDDAGAEHEASAQLGAGQERLAAELQPFEQRAVQRRQRRLVERRRIARTGSRRRSGPAAPSARDPARARDASRRGSAPARGCPRSPPCSPSQPELLHRHPDLQRAEAARLLKAVFAEPGQARRRRCCCRRSQVRRHEAERRSHRRRRRGPTPGRLRPARTATCADRARRCRRARCGASRVGVFGREDRRAAVRRVDVQPDVVPPADVRDRVEVVDRAGVGRAGAWRRRRSAARRARGRPRAPASSASTFIRKSASVGIVRIAALPKPSSSIALRAQPCAFGRHVERERPRRVAQAVGAHVDAALHVPRDGQRRSSSPSIRR